MQELKHIIETAYERHQELSSQNVDATILTAIQKTLLALESGALRTAEKVQGNWQIHQWIKKAILLYFRCTNNELMPTEIVNFYDKVPQKYHQASQNTFKKDNIRLVPPACVRKGAYIGKNTIIMPSFINMGAYVDEGCMIDTWASVGSCAQIGKNVHLSGGAGIGGVLEPLQANPTIIEDNCFIGARSEIVEGVIVEEGSVISMGVFIGQSTRIYDRTTDTILYGRIPAGSVVVAGNLPANNGRYSLYCAVIVKKVDAKTKQKVSLNELLRSKD